MTRHLQIAQEEGPKAGFRAYMSSKVPTAADRRAQIVSAGNSKAQFATYCGIFKDDLDKIAAGNHSKVQREDTRSDIIAALEGDPNATTLRKRLAALLSRDTEEIGVEVEAADEDDDEVIEDTPTKIVATRISWPMVMALKRAAAFFGEGFSIDDKHGSGYTASYSVTIGGDVLNGTDAEDCAFASDVIGEWKQARAA